MLKRVRAMVRHTVRSSILGEALANVKPQLYFNSIGEMIRSKNKEEYCWVLIRSTRRQIKGRLEWAGIICI
jgi:hypothetical protein